MRMKWLPGAIAALLCIALGWYGAKRLKEREGYLQHWERALHALQNGVNRGGLSLPLLMEQGGTDSLKEAARLLREAPALSGRELTQRLPRDPLLTDPEWQAVCQLIQGLFAPDREGQSAAIRCAGDQFARFSALAREAAEKNIRLYQSLGWLSGAAAFILLC